MNLKEWIYKAKIGAAAFFILGALALIIPWTANAQTLDDCGSDQPRFQLPIYVVDETGRRWMKAYDLNGDGDIVDTNDLNQCISSTPDIQQGVNVEPGGGWTSGTQQICNNSAPFYGGGFQAHTPKCTVAASGTMGFVVTPPPGYLCSQLSWKYTYKGALITSGSGNCSITITTPPQTNVNSGYRLDVALRTCDPNPANPTNLVATCNAAGTSTTLSWTASPEALSGYAIRVRNENAGPVDLTCNANGDFCNDNVNTTSYTFASNPNDNYVWWIHSRCGGFYSNPGVGAPSWSRCTPNCYGITGKTSLEAGVKGFYNANVQTYNPSVVGYLITGNTYVAGNVLPATPPLLAAGMKSGTIRATVTFPLALAGTTQTINCRAFNSARDDAGATNLQCASPGYTDTAARRYSCRGPSSSISVQVTRPQPWYKLKNASLHRNSIDVSIPAGITAYDPADTNEEILSIGEAGVVSATNTITVNARVGTAGAKKVSIDNWALENYDFVQPNLSDLSKFAAYLKEEKPVNNITALSQIQSNKVNVITGPGYFWTLSINSTNVLPSTPDNYILLVEGQVEMTAGGTFNPLRKNIAIISTSDLGIGVYSSYTELNGIFIAKYIDLNFDLGSIFPDSANQIKINGNLITDRSLRIKRTRADVSKPTFFIDFNPNMYVKLLPLLSTITFDGRQIQ